MTKQRKVVQISSASSVPFVLCNDGSMWNLQANSWEQVPRIPELDEDYISIKTIGLSKRIENYLMMDDIYTVNQLKIKTDKDLLRLTGIGKNSLKEIKKALKPYSE